MNETTKIDRDDRCPGTSYTEMLEADTRHVPDYLFEESSIPLSNDPLPIAPYISEEFAKLEREKMWPNVWLFAAREDEMPEPGDTVVFEINDKSFLLIRQRDGSVRAFYNVCLHRGRKLRTKSGKSTQLRCAFHGFTWANDGSLKEIPCAWDFKHLEGKDMSLPEVRVNIWQGFVMITENDSIPEFVDWVGPVLKQYERYDMEDRFTAMWVSKRIPANWKATAEAFMEAWHSVTTHPQLLPFLGDANSRYDLYGDFFNRAITPSGVLSPHITGKDQQYILDKMNEFSGGSDSQTNRRFSAGKSDADADTDDPFHARKMLAEANREGFKKQYGYDYSDKSDAEMLDNFTYNIFPNFSPWIGYIPTLLYRWLPGDTPDWCTMEIRVLMPKPKGEKRPRAVEKLVIPDDEPFAWANDVMGEALANVFDQDMANLPHVQTGMKASANGVMELGAYQDSRVRHFQNTLMKYINGELPG
ncbi:aromatic ring-hydroxylating oxygenase subunit alpha [Tsuneonella mangrovi]|uniref:aromatic ring-hydroxylating oxygenase subunit alpha n=1 Tax=Tsuneonella mangrovi TaxID=1982042 RepID=UPI000BA2BC05|nr:aromatic ring-hydroxylating dioxygenase subunit alpha [Tsuneonella mangrovi]